MLMQYFYIFWCGNMIKTMKQALWIAEKYWGILSALKYIMAVDLEHL